MATALRREALRFLVSSIKSLALVFLMLWWLERYKEVRSERLIATSRNARRVEAEWAGGGDSKLVRVVNSLDGGEGGRRITGGGGW